MTNLVQIIAAIIAVESGGNDFAIGDGGLAIGALQIHAGVVADVNRIFKKHYSHSGMTNRVDAVAVFKSYIEIYAKNQPPEIVARVWNGGPTGHKKKATLPYWGKVSRKIKSNS